ncbi:MAG: hypothetical protein VX815_15085 [Gemmatimonadota bacterium]|nr:hypothetical protein [Gemmatimonadota bacterium]
MGTGRRGVSPSVGSVVGVVVIALIVAVVFVRADLVGLRAGAEHEFVPDDARHIFPPSM